MSMFTRAFAVASTERALKSGAQFALTAWGQDAVGINVFSADLGNVAGAAAAGIVFSLLTSVASSGIGVKGSPSLAAEAEVEAATPP